MTKDVVHFRYQWYEHTLCGIKCLELQRRGEPWYTHTIEHITCDDCKEWYRKKLEEDVEHRRANLDRARTSMAIALRKLKEFNQIKWRDDDEQ